MDNRTLTLIFCIILSLNGPTAEYSDIIGLSKKVYKLDGDIMIGGVFPLHQSGPNGTFCGKLRELGVLQRAEAMAFYIQQANKDWKRQGINITLGFTILDDCYKETTALAQGLQFIPKRRYPDDKVQNDTKHKDDVVAVIGAESSTNSKQLAELLGLFQIPQISYLSTSPTLGNRIAYPYFTRIVPSDKYQIDAMVDLMEHFKWSYVSFIFSLDFYGIDAYMLLSNKIKNDSRICLASDIAIQPNPSQVDFDDALDSLVLGSNNKASHVVILFLSQTSALGILKTAEARGLRGNFTWIASDAWGRNTQDFREVQEIAEGTLTMKINSTNDPEFDKHFAFLGRESRNPYLKDFWDATCSMSNTSCSNRTKFMDMSDVYQPESTISLVKAAVTLLVNSLRELLKRCRLAAGDKACDGFMFRQYINGTDLQEMLRGQAGCLNSTCISVDRVGEGRSPYSIMNYQRLRDGGHILRPIGSYDSHTARLSIFSDSSVYWNPTINSDNFENGVPLSICSKSCQLGQGQKRAGSENSKCCWTCLECQNNEYTNISIEKDGLETLQCTSCKTLNRTNLLLYTRPNEQKNNCELIKPRSIGPTDPAAAVILSLAIFCCVITVGLLVVYIRNKAHRLIKATSLELSYIIWSGVIFSYVSIVFYFVPLHHGCPSTNNCNPRLHTQWCYIQFITFSLSFTVINAPMLTRVNRIYRIFTKGKKSAIKPQFIENKYQLMFVAALVAVQAVIILICCLVSHFSGIDKKIEISNFHEETNSEYTSLFCDIPYSILLPPVIYNLLLSIACAYHAFATRKLPDNFNESRFIGLTVYTTVIMWLAFIPAYIVLSSKLYKGVPLSVALLINAVITTGCLFVPRLYALRWIEGGKMNLRSLSISMNSLSDKRRASVPDVATFDRLRTMSNESQKTRSTCDRQSSDSGVNSNSAAVTSYISNSDISSSVLRETSSSSSPESDYDTKISSS